MKNFLRRPPVYVAITALVAFVAGAAFMLVVNSSSPGEDSPEAGFARDMSTHHSQAVAMSMHQWEAGEDDALRAIAYDIATGQQGEIGMMSDWLRDWNVSLTATDPPMQWAEGDHEHEAGEGLMPGQATPEEMDELFSLEGHEADVMFAELMIRHHIGGIDMAEAVLPLTNEDSVYRAALRMKSNQETEVRAVEMHLERILAA